MQILSVTTQWSHFPGAQSLQLWSQAVGMEDELATKMPISPCTVRTRTIWLLRRGVQLTICGPIKERKIVMLKKKNASKSLGSIN